MLNKEQNNWRTKVLQDKNLIARSLSRYLPFDEIQYTVTGSWNAFYRITADGDEYCLKVMNTESFPIEWFPGELNYVGEAMHLLRKNGFGCIVPALPAFDGQFTAEIAGYSVMLFPWKNALAERNPSMAADTEKIAELTEMMVRLHTAGRDVVKTIGERRTNWSRLYRLCKWPNELERIYRSQYQKLKQQSAPSELVKVFKKANIWQQKLILKNPGLFAANTEKDTLIHGDFRFGNMIMSDHTTFIFDFDFARQGRPEEEIAYTALFTSGKKWFAGNRDWDLCFSIIESYTNKAAHHQLNISTSTIHVLLIWTILKEIVLAREASEIGHRFQILEDLAKMFPQLL